MPMQKLKKYHKQRRNNLNKKHEYKKNNPKDCGLPSKL